MPVRLANGMLKGMRAFRVSRLSPCDQRAIEMAIHQRSSDVNVLGFANRRVVFMTNHAIADELFRGEYEDIRAAYREGEGNITIRAVCQREVCPLGLFKCAVVDAEW